MKQAIIRRIAGAAIAVMVSVAGVSGASAICVNGAPSACGFGNNQLYSLLFSQKTDNGSCTSADNSTCGETTENVSVTDNQACNTTCPQENELLDLLSQTTGDPAEDQKACTVLVNGIDCTGSDAQQLDELCGQNTEAASDNTVEASCQQPAESATCAQQNCRVTVNGIDCSDLTAGQVAAICEQASSGCSNSGTGDISTLLSKLTAGKACAGQGCTVAINGVDCSGINRDCLAKILSGYTKGSTGNNAGSNTGSAQQTTTVSAQEQQVVVLVNQIRRANGLSELTLNEKLSSVARVKAEDMAQNGYFSHTSPTYGTPFEMMKSFGISYRTAGENIAEGYPDAQAVVDGWMNSPGHRANILNASFTQIGVGYAADGNVWSQMFIG